MPQSGGQPVRKDTGTVGRGDLPGSDGTSAGGHDASSSCSPPRAGVVIHATVEHIGVVGDTELCVNVKWPASAFCVQTHKQPAASADQGSDSPFVPENGPDSLIFGEAAADPGPFPPETQAKYTSSEPTTAPTASEPKAAPSGSKPKTGTWRETEGNLESSS